MLREAFGVNENLVYVCYDKTMKELSQHLIHEGLEDLRGIHQVIRHYEIFIRAIRGDKGSFPLTLLFDCLGKIVYRILHPSVRLEELID